MRCPCMVNTNRTIQMKFSKKKQLSGKFGKDSKTKKSLYNKLKDECQTIWSKIVRGRDSYTCQWCGSKDRTQGHHIVGKGISNKTGWFDPDNGMTLCYQCHFNRLKLEPEVYVAFRDKWLKERKFNYQDMKIKYNRRFKMIVSDLEIVKTVLLRRSKG